MLSFVAQHQEAIMAVIMLSVVGAAIGNYACSVVHRLPKGQTPFEKHPYCGSCDRLLQPIDLFPIVSYFFTRGKCRYCAAKIPAIYTVIEIISVVIMVASYAAFGVGELFLVNSAAAVFVMMLGAIYWQSGFVSSFLYVVAALLLLLSRALHLGDVFPATSAFVFVLVASLAAHSLSLKKRGEPFNIGATSWPWWLALLALVMHPFSWSVFLGISGVAISLLVAGFQRFVNAVFLPCVIVIIILNLT